jgi:hypothetical protein
MRTDSRLWSAVYIASDQVSSQYARMYMHIMKYTPLHAQQEVTGKDKEATR